MLSNVRKRGERETNSALKLQLFAYLQGHISQIAMKINWKVYNSKSLPTMYYFTDKKTNTTTTIITIRNIRKHIQELSFLREGKCITIRLDYNCSESVFVFCCF